MTKARRSHLLLHRFGRRKGDTQDLAAQLAPLEELQPAGPEKGATNGGTSAVVAQETGAIVVGRNTPTLPDDAIDVNHRKPLFEPVVIVIVGLLLAFIVFIAWQVSRMPSPQ